MLSPLLRENANFRRFFLGQSVSLIGDQITAIALPLTAVLASRNLLRNRLRTSDAVARLADVAIDQDLGFGLVAQGDQRHVPVSDGEERNFRCHGVSTPLYG